MYKNKLKKFLAASTGLLVLAGCGSGGGGGEASTTDIEDLPEPGVFDDKVELELSGSFTKGNVVDDNWVQQKLEEQFNVDITNVKTDTWDSQETSILVASGELPDAFAFTAGGLTPLEFYEDGLTRAIPRDMIEKYAPNYAKMLDEEENGLGWELNKIEDLEEDAYAALLGYQGHTKGFIWAPSLRMDWMENLGIEIPEDAAPISDGEEYQRIYRTEKQYTLEELEEILTAFTYDDPDGNGKDDTVGMLPNNSSDNQFLTLFGAHGVTPSFNLIEDGELVAAPISQGYKDTLKLLNDWYEKGLIDEEWTTLDEKMAWEKYSQGSIGYYVGQRAYYALESWTDGRAPQNILDSDPNAKLLMINHEIGPDGHSGQPAYLPVTLLADAMHISANVTDEQLARYLQMYDFMNYTPEGVWTRYGNPGEHSDYMGEEGHSTLVVRDEYDLEEGDTGFWAYSHRTYYKEQLEWLNHLVTKKLMDEFFAESEAVEKYAMRPERSDIFNETNNKELESRYGAALGTMVVEFKMNAITGKVDIDEEWDNYVKTWRESGGDEILAELEKAPKVSDLLGE